MRIGLCNEVIATLPFEQQCAFARAVGYDGLEIAPMTLGDEPHRLPAARRAELRRMAADAGIAITGLHYVLRAPAGLSITSADAAVRARTVDVMRALCELAVDFGAGYLVHGSPQQRELAPGDETEGRKRGAACFAAVAEAAEAARVTYCIEPLSPDQTAFVNTVAEAATIVLEINSPAVKHDDRLLGRGARRRGRAGSRPAAQVAADRTDRPRPFQRPEPARTGRGGFAVRIRSCAPCTTAAIRAWPRSSRSIYRPDGPTCAARSIGYIRGLIEALAR